MLHGNGMDAAKLKRKMQMRDGSLEDVVGMWVDSMIEERGLRHPVEDEAAVYFVLLKKAVYGLLQTHNVSLTLTVDYREMLTDVLKEVRRGVARSTGIDPADNDEVEPALTNISELPQSSAIPPNGKQADYWASDSWRKDFYTTFNRWFWDMKDYAHAAGRQKSHFLRDVAEVWVATAASAMVYYAKDDRQRWFETAQMLRHYADLTEEDGLRSLSWGRWGRYAKKNHEPKH
jgi:hypothetical protein